MKQGLYSQNGVTELASRYQLSLRELLYFSDILSSLFPAAALKAKRGFLSVRPNPHTCQDENKSHEDLYHLPEIPMCSAELQLEMD